MALQFEPNVDETYDVSGAGLRDAAAALDPEEAGSCRWDVSYEYDSVDRRGRAVGLRLRARITIRMPVWTDRESAPAADREEWDRFRAALLEHERGHERRARARLPETHRRLLETPAAELGRVYQDELTRLQRDSDAYDTATDHGRRPPPGTNITFPAAAP